MADETRNQQRAKNYAEALFAIALTEHQLGEVEDELFRFKQVLETSDELRTTLSDQHLTAARRQQIVEDLLEGKATNVTTALVSMLVALDRVRDLPAIVDRLVEMSARTRQHSVAEVRSAIDLTDDQKTRLAAALTKATGKQVEVKVVVDPSVMGGIVSQVDDTVIDGSIRTRLHQLKESI